MVTIAEIAKRLQVDLTTVRRLIARESDTLLLQLHRGKGDKLLLSKDDAERLIASYEARRGPIPVSGEPGADVKYDRYGYFYLIQLVPEALPDRVKIGFADNVEKRLAEHRTAAPTARLLKSWPCKRSWDYVAMDSIARNGCKLVLYMMPILAMIRMRARIESPALLNRRRTRFNLYSCIHDPAVLAGRQCEDWIQIEFADLRSFFTCDNGEEGVIAGGLERGCMRD
jgi:hypothetical protein